MDELAEVAKTKEQWKHAEVNVVRESHVVDVLMAGVVGAKGICDDTGKQRVPGER